MVVVIRNRRMAGLLLSGCVYMSATYVMSVSAICDTVLIKKWHTAALGRKAGCEHQTIVQLCRTQSLHQSDLS